MKSKSKILGLIACIAIIVALCVFVYAKTDLLKSPKELFYKYLGKSVESEFDYSEFLEQYKTISQKSYNTTTSFSADVKSDSIDEEIAKAISDSKIIVEQKVDPSKEKIYESVELKYKDNEGIKAEFLGNNNQYALKSDILHDKYISIENKNLKELLSKFGYESDDFPDEIKIMDTYEFLYISNNDLKTIKQTYMNVLDSTISKDSYKAEKNVDITVNGESIKSNSYTLTVSEKQFYDAGVKTLETLETDDLTLDIIESKLNMLYENGMITEDQRYSKDDIKASIKEILDELKSSESEVSENENIKITVYESKGKTVKIEMETQDNTVSVQKYSKDNHKVIIIEGTESGSSTGKFTIDYTLDKKGNEKNIIGTLTIESDSIEEPLKINYDCTKTGDDNKYSLKASIGTTIEDVTVKLNVESNADFTSKVEIEDLNDDNSVILNNLSDEELNALIEEIVSNVQERLPKKLESLGLNEETLNELIEEGSELTQEYSSYDDYDEYNYYNDGEVDKEIEEKYNEILERYQNGEISLTEASDLISELYNN